MKKLFLVLFVLCSLFSFHCFPQRQDRIWVFGDSVGIDFNNLSNPTVFTVPTVTVPDEGFASVADNNGNLLYYMGPARNTNYQNYSGVYNGSFQMIQNGDSLFTNRSFTQGDLFIPENADTDKTLLFYIWDDWNGPPWSGLAYARLSRYANSGGGSVLMRDSLIFIDELAEKITAVRHANGRDWWIIAKADSSDKFYKILIQNDSIIYMGYQRIGPSFPPLSTYIIQGQMIFDRAGDKLAYVGTGWPKVAVLDFDRCTGIFSNYRGYHTPNTSNYGCSFSPTGKYVYVSDFDRLYQVDAESPDTMNSFNLIYQDDLTDSFLIGASLLAPDDKIYIVSGFESEPNNVFDHRNMNLSVIQNPNNPGVSCNFDTLAFHLGGHRAYGGLPNMVNYNLGPLIGSPCDTLTVGVSEKKDKNDQINIFPNPATNNVTISSNNNFNIKLILYDLDGRETLKYSSDFSRNYSISLSNIPNGVYIMSVGLGEKNIIYKKLVVIK